MVVAELFAKLGLKVDKKSWSVGNDVIAGMGKALAVFAGYKVATSIGKMVTDTLAIGDAASNTAKKLGITAEAVQELGFAASQSGSSGEALNASLGKLAAGLTEVRKTGKGPVRDALRALRISFKDLGDESIDQNLELIADRFAKLPDGPRKAKLAVDLFGKSGKDMIPLLNEGAEGIVKLRNEAQELGGVIDNETAGSMDDVGDSIDKVKFSLAGLRNSAVKALLPVIQEMTEGLIKWIKANRQMLVDKLTSLIRGLASALQLAGRAVAFVVEHWQIMVAAIAGTAVVTSIIRFVKLIEWLSAASTRAAIRTVAAWALAALPFVAIAALIALLVLAMTKYRDRTRQVVQKIKAWFRDLWADIKNGFRAAFNYIANLPVIKQLIQLVEKIAELPGKVSRGVSRARNAVSNFVGPTTGDVVQDLARRKAAEDRAATIRAIDAPRRPISAGGGTTTITNGDIIVNTPATDPKAVGDEVRRQVNRHWDNKMRQSFYGTGAE